MARFRWLSTWTLLGTLLLVLGIVGLVLGPKFIYDPGQMADGKEPLAYLAVGVLMLLNGFLSPAAPEADVPQRVRTAGSNATTPPASPAAATHTADRSTD